MMRTVVSEVAEAEVHEIWAYWAERVSEQVADRQVDRIWANVALLARQPGAGRLVEEFGPSVRVLSAKKFLIYYEIREDVVWVAHVVAGEREQRRAVLGER